MEVFDSRRILRNFLKDSTHWPKTQEPKHILMVSPEYFRIDYAINPYMSDDRGHLQTMDRELAASQWMELKKIYQELGYSIHVLRGHPELPDMVFAANQSFAYLCPKTQRQRFFISNMKYTQRKPEPRFFARWYQESGYDITEIPENISFEGCGDTLIHPKYGLILGGYGFRTDKQAFEFVAQSSQIPVVRLALKNPSFYHLDTCLAILDGETAAVHMKAFDDEGMGILRELFPKLIDVTEDDALESFACNAHCPNGKDVILQKGSLKFVSDLRNKGFRTHEIDTSEFVKAGGSVFCLKMMF